LQNVPQLPFLGIPASAFAALGGLQFFYANAPTHGPVNYPNANESGILKGHKLTYLARAAYDFGRINAYVSYSTGWKSGAYNLSYDARAPDVNGIGRTADPENTTLYEAGLKTRFRGGFVNLAVFKQSIKGFQSNAYTGTGYSLVNAGKESVKGFEVDAAARPLPWLSLTGGLTYLDAKYNSFLRAPCVSFDPVCPVNSAGQFITPFRDLSGQRPAGIPKWNASTSATISHDFGNGLSSFVRGEFDYSSKVQLVETVPANLSTYGNRNFNASIGIVSAPIGAQILFWARNLTNYKTIVAAFPTVAQQGSYTGYPNEPRTYGVTLTKRF
jgi:iron complex outermembrane receptor protein